MNEHGYVGLSNIQGDNAGSANVLHSFAEGRLEEVLSSPKPLPPKRLKKYTTKKLWRRHTKPWLVYSILAIVATILIATLLRNSKSSDQKECMDSVGSGTEELFRINIVLIRGLSFARAKSLDLLWDTAIGQGGRFVHGLILHQLVSKALTLFLESSTLPYSFFLGVKFSAVSFESLWCCIQLLFAKNSIRTSFLVAGLFLAISHVLAFATIWSATTGYEADTVPAYDILNAGAFVPRGSDRLTTCWSVQDLDRVVQGRSEPILGPIFAQAYGNWGNIGDQKEFRRLKMRTKSPAVKTSEAFANLYAYAIAKETFLRRYNTTQLAQLGHASDTDKWSDRNCYNSGIETAVGYNFTKDCVATQLYKSVDGWQYAGHGQRGSENLPSDPRDEENLHSNSRAKPNDSDYVPYNTTFLLDHDIQLKENVVPYNSTIWWNGTRTPLDAPFLNIGSDCQWFGGSLGLCLCLDGNVLTTDFRHSGQICLNDTGYLWGFSWFLLLIGFALEATWLLMCSLMWYVISTRSKLIKLHRPGTGTIRSILDIAGAINLSIGTDNGAYTEHELKRELEKHPPIGFDVDNYGGVRYERIRLRPMRHAVGMRRNLWVNRHTLYG
ncbi:hypothetical protein F4679DRAFT_538398 [Xylaria curta]|nr:hypothetical protein F4679DRAFT_538398 [Xylaria curta]